MPTVKNVREFVALVGPERAAELLREPAPTPEAAPATLTLVEPSVTVEGGRFVAMIPALARALIAKDNDPRWHATAKQQPGGAVGVRIEMEVMQ